MSNIDYCSSGIHDDDARLSLASSMNRPVSKV